MKGQKLESTLGSCNERQQSVIHAAAANGHVRVLTALDEIKDRAKLNFEKQDVDGKTAAWIAAENGKANVLEYFVKESKSKPDIKTPDKLGRTPAWIAAKNAHVNVLEVLNDLVGKDLLATADQAGVTPAHVAAKYGHAKVIQCPCVILRNYFCYLAMMLPLVCLLQID